MKEFFLLLFPLRFKENVDAVLIGETGGSGEIRIVSEHFLIENPLTGVGVKGVQVVYGIGADACSQQERRADRLIELFGEIGRLYEKGVMIADENELAAFL